MSFFFNKQKNKTYQKSWQRKSTRTYFGTVKKGEANKKNKFSRFLFWLLLVGFSAICLYLLFFSSYMDVENISVEGNKDIPAEEIIKQVGKALEGNYFGYFPKNNFFLINKKSINNALQNSFNRLEVASIEKKFPNTILVRVAERKAELVWCSGGVCYFVDGSGLAYSGASGSEEDLRNSNSLVVIDDSARPIDIGKTVINPDYIEYIAAVSTMLSRDLKISLAESYHTPGMASGEISARTGEDWILKLSSEISAEEAKTIIQSLFDKELNEEKRKDLDYLDLRIKGKVYYKLKAQN